MTAPTQAPRDFRRRRENRALRVLRRINNQRTRLAQIYGAATTAGQRLRAVADALVAAAANHPDDREAENALDRIIDAARRELAVLHDKQAAAAEKTLRIEQERRERRVSGAPAAAAARRAS